MEKKYLAIYNFYLYFHREASAKLIRFMETTTDHEFVVNLLDGCHSIFDMNDVVSDIDI